MNDYGNILPLIDLGQLATSLENGIEVNNTQINNYRDQFGDLITVLIKKKIYKRAV